MAAKNKTNGAPLPAQGDSRRRSPNDAATIASANRYRRGAYTNALCANPVNRERAPEPLPMVFIMTRECPVEESIRHDVDGGFQMRWLD
jgi:hypothetical protein